LCFEIEALESEVTTLNDTNESNLYSHSHQSHEKEKIQEIKRVHDHSIERLSLSGTPGRGEEENQDEDDFNPIPPAPPTLTPSHSNSPARINRKTVGPNDDHKPSTKSLGKGMQSEMISQLKKQKERSVVHSCLSHTLTLNRDRERDLKFREEKKKQRNRLFSDEIEENGISSWSGDDKLKNMFIDVCSPPSFPHPCPASLI
jgi:hypothetical protein